MGGTRGEREGGREGKGEEEGEERGRGKGVGEERGRGVKGGPRGWPARGLQSLRGSTAVTSRPARDCWSERCCCCE